MRKLICIILLFYSLDVVSQVRLENRMTKSQVSSVVNNNIKILFNHINQDWYNSLDTLSDTHTSVDLYNLNSIFDSIATHSNISYTPLEYGTNGYQIRQIINNNFINLYNAQSGYDWNFTLSAGIKDTTEVNAIKFLVSSFTDSVTINNKKYIYPKSKFHAIYPVVGNSESSHKYNLISPYDADSSYRLTFNGSLTHSDNGIQGNGFTGYVNSHFKPTNSYQNLSVGFYSAEDTFRNTTSVNWGIQNESNNFLLATESTVGAGFDQTYYFAGANVSLFVPAKETQGNFYVTLTDTAMCLYRDGSKIVYSHKIPGSIADNELYFLALHNLDGSTWGNTRQRMIFATIAENLTDEEVFNATIIEREFNKRLGRFVDSFHVGRDVSKYPITLDYPIEKDWYPDTTGNQNYDLWNSFNVGAAIHFQQRSWFSSFENFAHTPYFGDDLPDTIDVGNWIAHLDTFGVDYAFLTVMESTGFAWDTMPPFPKRLVDKYNSFATYDSRNNPFADKNLVQNFVDTCRASGIEPIIYINPVRNLLFTPRTNFTFEIMDSLDIVYYNNWFQKFAQMLVEKYDLNFIWIDGWKYGPSNEEFNGFVDSLYDGTLIKSVDYQGLYNAIKSADSTCLVIMNDWADTTFSRFPFDIASAEELVIDIVGISDVDLVRDSTLTHDDVVYHIPYEFICNVAGDVDGGSGFWYCTKDEGVDVRPLTQVQSFYDRAKTIGAKFNLSVIPGRNGVIQEEQFEIWRNIVW